jgi:NitT/TauT family transport system ATP-binding protein
VARVAVRNLSKYFGDGESRVTALEDISFEVSGSPFVSIVGPSGCGKSTLLNILSGILTPSTGTVEVSAEGHPARVGYVFQSARLLPWRSVLENLIIVQGNRSEETIERCNRYLNMVNLGHRAKVFPGELSGGMQQRVGIARAFSVEPDVLIMDEPFSHLDAITARTLRRELHFLWEETHKTVIFVTHDVGEAVELSERVLILAHGGRLVDDIPCELPFPREGASDEVALAKAHILKRFEELDLLAT